MRRPMRRWPDASPDRAVGEAHEQGAPAAPAPDADPAASGFVAQLSQALDCIGQGVIICDASGRILFRNTQAACMVNSSGGDLIAEQAVSEQLARALAGVKGEQTLELFSPHRRVLHIRAFPLHADAGPSPAAGIPVPSGSSASGLHAGAGSIASRGFHAGAAAFPNGAGPAGGQDTISGAVAVVEDVSERKRLEDVRRDFVANVSHELKTPVGALSLLAETLDGEEDPEVVTRLSTRVAAEAGRLGRLIDDLLDLSRIEANDVPADELIAVSTLVGEAVEPLRSVARSRDIGLKVVPVPRELAVPGVRRDLVSAITNLVDNAIKYSEPGGLVTVEVEHEQGRVAIAVSDQGLGIPSRDLERIFERFYRVDRARSRSTGGTGLGLSIVRHVAANHGGSVGVKSVEGEGSTFTLRLPAVIDPPAAEGTSG